MPYKAKGKCVYKKDTGKKVGCTKGPVKKYMAALHAATANESIESGTASYNLEFKNVRFPSKNTAIVTYHYKSKKDSIDVCLSYNVGRTTEDIKYKQATVKDANDIHAEPVKFTDPQSKELQEYSHSRNIKLDSEDIEMAGQDAIDRITTYFDDVPKLNEPHEESLEFENYFKTLINA